MILVDTSIWVDHLRVGDSGLVELLNEGQVLIHPFVIGELALGIVRQREVIFNALDNLPQAPVASHEEVMRFVVQNQLAGQGIGYVDVCLLAAIRLAPGSTLWTRDKRLLAVSVQLGLSGKGIY